MADVTPNYSLELQGLELEKSQLQLNVQSQLYRVAQTEDEIRRIMVNVDATKSAISGLDDKINTIKGI